jgi:alanine racemase
MTASQSSRGAWLEIDLAALRENRSVLRGALPPDTRLGLVVKADAYGHGMDAAARLAIASGVDMLMVATLEEGVGLRQLHPHVPILVLYPIPTWCLGIAAEARLTLTVTGEQMARELAEAADRLPSERSATAVQVHLEVDTGMTRDGAEPAEVLPTARALRTSRNLRHTGTWSHLATPEDRRASAAQVDRFEEALAALERAGLDPGLRHIASSGTILCDSAPPYELVRVGLAWYGVVPPEWASERPELVAALRPALSLRARALRIARVAAGTPVGYGAAWTAARESLIATLPVGYADGVARASWPGAQVLVRGRRVEVVGRVSMDALTVDVTDVGDVGLDDEFVLLGRQGQATITAVEVARQLGTIAWEVLVAFGRRLDRIYTDGGSALSPGGPWGMGEPGAARGAVGRGPHRPR